MMVYYSLSFNVVTFFGVFAVLLCALSCVCHTRLFVRHWQALARLHIICAMQYAAC